MEHKSVLVTGGAGFIGSHLVDRLIDKGNQVRVLDNLCPPTHNGRLPDWFNKKAEFVNGDVRKKKDWKSALAGVSYVFHLAAYMDYHLDFSTYSDTNVRSTALLYELIVQEKLPVKKIIIASSQAPYGEGKYHCSKHGVFYALPRSKAQLTDKHWDVSCPADGTTATILPAQETDELHPLTPYAVSKATAETLGLALGKIHTIPTVALRYSIVQGSRQSYRHYYSGALRDFAVRAVANLPILMQEDGGQLRDFVNVHDVVDAHLLVLGDSRANYEVFNVGSGQTTRVFDLAQTVSQITGNNLIPQMPGEYRIGSPRHTLLNIDKLVRLGWKPKRTLEDSVKEYVDWIQQYPEALRYWKKTYKTMRREHILKL